MATLAFALQKTWVLQAATLGPLALATVPEDSSLLALSSTLALTLAGMTFTRPAGVARQYCGHLGKKANCQSLVSLTLARSEVPSPVALRLLLPEDWVVDP